MYIDLFGVIVLIFFGFGWVKFVVIDLIRYRNLKVGMGLIVLVGFVVNIFFVIVFVIVFKYIDKYNLIINRYF